ncbi:PAS domain S-box-containing protein [Breznakibacter xylanolyticus]|uniref:histidine kinase n=2 Tax=Breznakibacter xylanolyticus TaxID=990 RepID=A0A2W7N456_9BACT|nr:PAS domain S-box-containing protein [Breznakibacter xylanolyticus]
MTCLANIDFNMYGTMGQVIDASTGDLSLSQYLMGVTVLIALLLLIGMMVYIRMLYRENKYLSGQLHNEIQLMKSVMEVMPYGVSIKGVDGRYLYCNERFAYELCVAAPERLSGKSFDELKLADPAWEVLKTDEMVVAKNGASMTEIKLKEPGDMPEKWFKVQQLKLQSSMGIAIGQVDMIEDISEWKNCQMNAAHKSEVLSVLAYMVELLGRTSHFGDICRHLIEQMTLVANARGGMMWEVETSDSGELFFRLLNHFGDCVKIDKTHFSVPKTAGDRVTNYVDLCRRVATLSRPLSSFQISDNDPAGKFFGKKDVKSYLFIPVSIKQNGVVAVICLLNIEAEREDEILDDLTPFLALNGYIIENVRTAKMKQYVESALSQSNRQLMSLMDNLPGTVFTCLNNADRSLTFMSKGCYLLTGYSSELFLSQEMGLQDLVHPEDRMMVWKKFQEAILSNNPYQINYRIITLGGDVRWIWESGKIASVNSPGGYLIDGVLMDITERVERNMRLVESENFCRSLLDAMPDRLFRVSQRGVVLATPQQSLFFSSFDSHHDAVGKHISNLFGLENEECLMDAIREVLMLRNLRVIELASGEQLEPYWLEIRIVPFGDNEVLMIVKDVTSDKLLEARFEQTEYLLKTQFEQGNIAMGILNDALNWSRVNHRMEKMSGMSGEWLSGLCWRDIVVPEDVDYTSVMFEQLRNGEKELIDVDLRIQSKDGRVIYTHTNISLIRNSFTEQLFYLVSMQDVTYRKELERKVLTSVIETEERERIRFAQELHDGLGPILSSIKMYVQWIQMPDLKTDPHVILSDTEHLVDEAHRTVREISFNMSPHVLKNFGLIPALETFTNKLSEVNRVLFDYQVTGIKGRFSEEVEIILYRVLTECINNAMKYAEASEIVISIEQSENVLSVCCRDNGKGFDVEDVLAKRKGMGLFNMNNRLRTLSGKLDIHSQPGCGTEVCMVLNLN